MNFSNTHHKKNIYPEKDNQILSNYAILSLYNINDKLNNRYLPKCNDVLTKITKLSGVNGIWGLFTTIKRWQKLQKWPEDIHGCLGYYNITPRPVKLSNELILSKISELIKDANTKDDRHTYFKRPVYEDALSTIEVSLMYGNLIQINPDTGELLLPQKRGTIKKNSGNNVKLQVFNNMDYGLIVVNENTNQTATYLPKVFPANMSWDSISRSLKDKAGIIKNDNSSTFGNMKGIKWYAYRTITFETIIGNFILGNEFIRPRLAMIQKFVFRLLESDNEDMNKLPYNISSDGVIEYDDKQYVRNLSVIMDLCNLTQKLGGNIHRDVFSKINLDMYLEIYKYASLVELSNSGLAQSVASALPLFVMLGDANTEIINKLSTFLINRVKSNELEPDFEWGQVMIALTNYAVNTDTVTDTDTDIKTLVDNQLSHMKIDKTMKIDNIFRHNWYVQFMVAYAKKWGYNKLFIIENIPNVVNDLIKVVFKIYDNINLDTYETNYLAVMFECLSGLYYLLNAINKDNNNIDGKNELMNKLTNIIYYLEQRYKMGLYYFNNDDARLDITGHVINGYLNII